MWKGDLLEKTLANFKIYATVVDISRSPTCTRYDVKLNSGVKVNSVIKLADDIALGMGVSSVRIQAPVPGKAVVGIEILNDERGESKLKDILDSDEYKKSKSPLTIGLGQIYNEKPYLINLEEMPHLLIAGTTGSGKSICIHSIIASILNKATPQQVKLMLVDPKRVEFTAYSKIAHLYDPNVSRETVAVITNPVKAIESLKKLVRVMEMRYEKYAKVVVRNIDGYNIYARQNGLLEDYRIVVIVDELADLMMVASKEMESVIQRLSQMARSAGIHLVLATQRPSVDVITGVIKANFISRIAFRVSSQVDSRVILDCTGAESLAGKGDMLYLPASGGEPIRIQGVFVSDKDVQDLVDNNKKYGNPVYESYSDKKTNELLNLLYFIKEYKNVPHYLDGYELIVKVLKDARFISCGNGSKQWVVEQERIENYLKQVIGEAK